MSPPARRRQLVGPAALCAALESGQPVRLVLTAREPRDPAVRAAVARAHAQGVRVRHASANSLWRLGSGEPAPELLALVGPDPAASRQAVLAADGALWLLVGSAYAGNTGFAMRTAEVSGADGIFLANDFGHEGRREALRASMRADRFFPVFWEPALDVVRDARDAGRRVVAIEDVGSRAPWEQELTRPTLFVVGGERHGVPAEVLEACDAIVRIPMRGFIPAYNLQAAMAMVAGERLRQLAAREGGDPTPLRSDALATGSSRDPGQA